MNDHSRFLVSYGLHASQSAALVLEVLRAGLASVVFTEMSALKSTEIVRAVPSLASSDHRSPQGRQAFC